MTILAFLYAFGADLEATLSAYTRKMDLQINQQVRDEYQQLIEIQTAIAARRRIRKRYPDLTRKQISAIIDPIEKMRTN